MPYFQYNKDNDKMYIVWTKKTKQTFGQKDWRGGRPEQREQRREAIRKSADSADLVNTDL